MHCLAFEAMRILAQAPPSGVTAARTESIKQRQEQGIAGRNRAHRDRDEAGIVGHGQEAHGQEEQAPDSDHELPRGEFESQGSLLELSVS